MVSSGWNCGGGGGLVAKRVACDCGACLCPADLDLARSEGTEDAECNAGLCTLPSGS